jgi:hypothetical protein
MKATKRTILAAVFPGFVMSHLDRLGKSERHILFDQHPGRNISKTTKGLLNTNGGDGGIPYFLGASNVSCLAKAQAAGALAVASLTNLGCDASANSVLIPPTYGSYGTLCRNVFRSMPYYNRNLSIAKARS